MYIPKYKYICNFILHGMYSFIQFFYYFMISYMPYKIDLNTDLLYEEFFNRFKTSK